MEKFKKHPALTDDKLRWNVAEGISEAALHYQSPQSVPEKSLSYGDSRNEWKFMLPYEVSENKELLEGLQNGLEAAEIVFAGEELKSIPGLLKGVYPEMVEIHLHNSSKGNAEPMLDLLLKICKTNGTDSRKLRGSVRGCDPESVRKLTAENLSRLPGIKIYSFESASDTKTSDRIGELARIFRALLKEMELTELSPSEFMKRSLCRLNIGSDVIAEMVKIRAFHLLWSLVTDELQCGVLAPDLEISVHSSSFTEDPFKNLIISSTVALCSVVSGVKRLHFPVSSVDNTDKLSDPKSFSRRMTINISHILKHESHFNKITDPLAGSYTTESTAEKIAEKAWELATA